MTSARVLLPLGISALVLLGGCASAPRFAAIPPMLDLTQEVPGASVTLHRAVVLNGPGQWTEDAMWDEFVFTFRNPGSEPLIIETAAIVDLLNQSYVATSDPLACAAQSVRNWKRYEKGKIRVERPPKLFRYAPLVDPPGAAAPLYAVAMIVDPIGGIMLAAASSKAHATFQKEFDRRSLKLPCTVGPAWASSGSLFFPMTAAPKLLELRGRIGAVAVTFQFPLPALAQLHLDPRR